MARAFLFVLDSFGVGGGPDAETYGDDGADTLGHIAEFCAAGAGDREGLREGPLDLPNMSALGLLQSPRPHPAAVPPACPCRNGSIGALRRANEISRGKDTPSGHWEIAGTPVMFDWGYFPTEGDAFPPELVRGDLSRRRHAGHSRQLPCLGHGDHRAAMARSTSAPASRSATHRPTPSSRSPRMRRHFGLERLLEALPDRARPCSIR